MDIEHAVAFARLKSREENWSVERSKIVNEYSPVSGGEFSNFSFDEDAIITYRGVNSSVNRLVDLIFAGLPDGGVPNIVMDNRIMFARSQLNSLLIAASGEHPDDDPGRLEYLEAGMLRPWGDADVIASDPRDIPHEYESASVAYFNWCCTLAELDPNEDPQGVFFKAAADAGIIQGAYQGLALIWLDQAISHPAKALDLTAQVGALCNLFCFAEGWGQRGWTDSPSKSAREFALLGAKGRHRVNHEKKRLAVEWYEANGRDFDNKDDATLYYINSVAAGKFGTVRKWLKGIEAAPRA